MRANPGGEVRPEDVRGRSREIEGLWQSLETTGLRLEAPRRLGKSTICKKMAVEGRSGWIAIYDDFESCKSPGEFVRKLAKCLAQTSSGSARRFASVGAGVVQPSADFEEGLIERSWDEALQTSIQNFLDSTDGRCVLFLDEISMMLDGIAARDPHSAAEVLASLRSIRQTHGDRLRMVYTGSVGIHHVINRISSKTERRLDVYLNDFAYIPVGPIAADEAKMLAEELLEGENILCDNRPNVAACIADECCHVPFYIHGVVYAMRGVSDSVDDISVRGLVEHLLEGQFGTQVAEDYDGRIRTYYDKYADLALTILDTAAKTTRPISEAELQNAVVVEPETSIQDFGIAFHLLRKDFVLESEICVRFKISLVKRAWLRFRRIRPE